MTTILMMQMNYTLQDFESIRTNGCMIEGIHVPDVFLS